MKFLAYIFEVALLFATVFLCAIILFRITFYEDKRARKGSTSMQ